MPVSWCSFLSRNVLLNLIAISSDRRTAVPGFTEILEPKHLFGNSVVLLFMIRGKSYKIK